jgi:hypothetical protein
MRTLGGLLVCFVLASGMVYGQFGCLQDQYGNQYKFTVDETNTYVYGVVTGGQKCPAAVWNLTGSFATTSSGIALELTSTNPNGISDPCVPIYTLKGIMPNFEWYYVTGVSNPPQPGTWVSCGTKTSDTATGKGARK